MFGSPFDIIGELSGQAAKDCGLVPGIPVIAGTGDHPATAFGAGIVEPGMCYDISGSSNILGICTSSFVSNKVLSSVNGQPES